jgi:adenylylsulfate kinase
MEPQKGKVIWLTGLPCSGKSTIADGLEEYFNEKRIPIQKLDGDLLRATISKDLGFSVIDRYKQVERVAYIANMLSMHGVNVVVALVSPYRDMRDQAKKICSHMNEIFIKCSLEECKRRDVKGMYKKAINGELKNFTGVSDVYEPPLHPDLVIDTEKNVLRECLSNLIDFLKICCFVCLAIY